MVLEWGAASTGRGPISPRSLHSQQHSARTAGTQGHKGAGPQPAAQCQLHLREHAWHLPKAGHILAHRVSGAAMDWAPERVKHTHPERAMGYLASLHTLSGQTHGHRTVVLCSSEVGSAGPGLLTWTDGAGPGWLSAAQYRTHCYKAKDLLLSYRGTLPPASGWWGSPQGTPQPRVSPKPRRAASLTPGNSYF